MCRKFFLFSISWALVIGAMDGAAVPPAAESDGASGGGPVRTTRRSPVKEPVPYSRAFDFREVYTAVRQMGDKALQKDALLGWIEALIDRIDQLKAGRPMGDLDTRTANHVNRAAVEMARAAFAIYKLDKPAFRELASLHADRAASISASQEVTDIQRRIGG